MNQYSKEILEALDDLCKKYKIKQGLLLFVEEDISDFKKTKHRVIAFGHDNPELSVHEFANLLNNCIEVSKTMQDIVQHANMDIAKKIIKDIEINNAVFTSKKSNYIN